jgi:hypothetical protein
VSLNDRIRAQRAEADAKAANERADKAERELREAQDVAERATARAAKIEASHRELLQALVLTVNHHAYNLGGQS